MDILSNGDNPDNFNDFDDVNIKSSLDNINENWPNYDFPEPLFCTDDFLSTYDSSPINCFKSPYDELCMGLDSEIENISGSSSDSGLSSDNLDADIGDTLNFVNDEINVKGADIQNEVFINNVSNVIDNDSIARQTSFPKVVVQKVPQLFTVTANKTNTFGKISKPIHKFNNPKEIKIVKVAPFVNNSKNNNVTIQIKNSNINGKIQTNPGTFFISKGKIAEVKKSIQTSKNTNSIILPISVKGVHDLKKVKVLKCLPKEKVLQQQPINSVIYSEESKSEENYYDDDDDEIEKMDYEDEDIYTEKDVKYPRLVLTSEEKRLLSKEGISLPQHYPLTKNEERELKRIRRKIRNKISAQDSRKRKKDYVVGLEARVKQCTEENQNLMKRIKMLQLQNQSLVSQMKKMQNLLTKGTDKITHPTTCLMVLLMSLALITAPNLNLTQSEKELALDEFAGNQDIAVQNRNLLSNSKTNAIEIFDEDKSLTAKNNLKLVDYDVDDRNWYEMKAEAENNSNHVHSNIFPMLLDDVNKESINEGGDTLELFSSAKYLNFNFDIPNGAGNAIDESKMNTRNENDLKTPEIMTPLNVLSFPK